jgi:hypothetical protein
VDPVVAEALGTRLEIRLRLQLHRVVPWKTEETLAELVSPVGEYLLLEVGVVQLA